MSLFPITSWLRVLPELSNPSLRRVLPELSNPSLSVRTLNNSLYQCNLFIRTSFTHLQTVTSTLFDLIGHYVAHAKLRISVLECKPSVANYVPPYAQVRPCKRTRQHIARHYGCLTSHIIQRAVGSHVHDTRPACQRCQGLEIRIHALDTQDLSVTVMRAHALDTQDPMAV